MLNSVGRVIKIHPDWIIFKVQVFTQTLSDELSEITMSQGKRVRGQKNIFVILCNSMKEINFTKHKGLSLCTCVEK